MDRIIKFRFWRDNKMHLARQLNAYTDGNFSGDGEILMQFTGLLDCEGKEIWEGQIVDNDYLVVFLLGKFQLKLLSNNTYQDIYDNQHKITGECYKMEEN